MPELLAAAAILIVFAAFVSLIEHQVKTQGSLIAGVATPRMRLLALLLGIVFAAICVGEWITDEPLDSTFLLLAVALIGYSLGVGIYLQRIQGEPDPDVVDLSAPPSKQVARKPIKATPAKSEPILPLNRIVRLLLLLLIGSVLAAAAIYIAMLAAAHPDHPLSGLLVIGVIIFFAVVKLRSWLGSLLRQ